MIVLDKLCAVFKNFEKPVPRLLFNPRRVPAVLEQDKSKARQRGRQGLLHACGRMGVVIAVDRNHRTHDVPGEFQKFSTPPQFSGILPHALKDVPSTISNTRFVCFVFNGIIVDAPNRPMPFSHAYSIGIRWVIRHPQNG